MIAPSCSELCSWYRGTLLAAVVGGSEQCRCSRTMLRRCSVYLMSCSTRYLPISPQPTSSLSQLSVSNHPPVPPLTPHPDFSSSQKLSSLSKTALVPIIECPRRRVSPAPTPDIHRASCLHSLNKKAHSQDIEIQPQMGLSFAFPLCHLCSQPATTTPARRSSRTNAHWHDSSSSRS